MNTLKAAILFCIASTCEFAYAAPRQPLELQARVALGEVRGRIDHLAIDPGRKRLFVAELGNDSIGVVDLESLTIVKRLTGLAEPQGIAYSAAADALFVANAGDGSVRIFEGADLSPAGTLVLGDDADNVRADDASHSVFVGYGSGALAVIDASTRRRLADIRLNGHPEGFQLAAASPVIIVNVPDAHEIAVVDRHLARQTGAWPTGKPAGNFPLALDESAHRVVAIFRRPPVVAIFSEPGGGVVGTVATCADADDVFLDDAHRRMYVICGEGFIDVFEQSESSYRRIARVATVTGARTGLWVSARAELFLAVRGTRTTPAGIWIYHAVE